MKDPILEEALERGLADRRGLYIAANVFADGRQLGRVWVFLNETKLFLAELNFPAGIGESLRVIELTGARAEVVRFLVPLALRLESPQGRFEFKGFRDAKQWLAAVKALCQ